MHAFEEVARRGDRGALLRRPRRRATWRRRVAQGGAPRAHPEPASTGIRRGSSASSRRGTTRSRWASPTPSRRSSPATRCSTSPTLQTPFSLLWALDLLIECGLPEDLYAGRRRRRARCSGPSLFDAVDYLQFTGSTATGRLVAREAGVAADRLLARARRQEPDAGPRRRRPRRRRRRRRARLFLLRRPALHLDRTDLRPRVALRPLPRRVRRARPAGSGSASALDWSCDVGSLASAKQLATVEPPRRRRASPRGARVEPAAEPRPDLGPLFYEPTMLTGVAPGDDALRRGDLRSGGRGLPVRPRTTRRSSAPTPPRYGLNASIWSRDTELARRMATRLDVRHGQRSTRPTSPPGRSIEAPMGGFKDSGLGRRHGAEGILKYTEAQTVTRAARHARSRRPPACPRGLRPLDDRRAARAPAGAGRCR